MAFDTQTKYFVVRAEEYSSVKEHVLMNFGDFLSDFRIENLYIQNPPENVLRQLQLQYKEKQIEIMQQKYKRINNEFIRKVNEQFDQVIIGQENAKKELLRALFLATIEKRHKPVVILFYGESGIGKTETVQFLGQLLDEKVFRKQFSMFQSNEFYTYMFGGMYNENSFSKDLLGRSSNLILLDEFDKANSIFYSAFYQLFDEGIIEDAHYKAELKDAVIICTSNFHDIEQIRNDLGDPIFNRFDAIIKFNDLTLDAKKRIAQKIIDEIQEDHSGFKFHEKALNNLFDSLDMVRNAREINRIIKEMFAYIELEKILNEINNDDLSDGCQ